ncbi:MAG: hypothetical protein HY549_00710 [Elusimicrobia bacterium]|nr:hypothetical protein [Elusimicrobiota bacterium]
MESQCLEMDPRPVLVVPAHMDRLALELEKLESLMNGWEARYLRLKAQSERLDQEIAGLRDCLKHLTEPRFLADGMLGKLDRESA